MTLWVMMDGGKGSVMFGDRATVAWRRGKIPDLFCFSNFKRRSFFI